MFQHNIEINSRYNKSGGFVWNSSVDTSSVDPKQQQEQSAKPQGPQYIRHLRQGSWSPELVAHCVADSAYKRLFQINQEYSKSIQEEDSKSIKETKGKKVRLDQNIYYGKI